MQVEFIVASIFALIVFGIVHMYVGGKKAKRVWREKFLKEWGKFPKESMMKKN